jgi:hypothetical protein
MTDTGHRPTSTRDRVDPMRGTASVAGALYLVTFVTSMPALILKGPVLHHSDFILGTGGESGVLWAGFLEVVLALACIGTAVVLFPVVRRQSETAALGFVTARVLEAAIIVLGAVSLLAVVTLRHNVAGTAGADEASLLLTSTSLVAIHDWAFLLGPGLLPAVNAALLGYVLYRSRLVPRAIPTIGLIGVPLLAISATTTLFGITDQVSVVSAIGALPIALWELSLGIWLVTKGFRPQALAELGSGGPVQDSLQPAARLASRSAGT